MSGPESLQSVQFVTIRGERYAVLRKEDWDAMLEWLEDLVDVRAARKVLAELAAAGGDHKRAGWVEWKDIDWRKRR